MATYSSVLPGESQGRGSLTGCGLRVSELVGLDCDRIDLDEGFVLVMGKGTTSTTWEAQMKGTFDLVASKSVLRGSSLAFQCLRIYLAMQGTWLPSLVRDQI